jgi:hypothetical protein
MAEETAIEKATSRLSLVQAMAARFQMEPGPFLDTIRQTVFPTKDRDHNPIVATNAQVAALLAVAHEYNLNPFTRELFAFPTKGGGIQPIVSVDGWVKLIVTHPDYKGMDIVMKFPGDDASKKPISVTVTIHRKSTDSVTPITEYFEECYRDTDPWKGMPRRMLRHKGIKEAGRVTFGFSGISDQDEAMDAINITGESIEIERTTNAKAEVLKERIGAKKEKKTEEAKVTAPTQGIVAPERLHNLAMEQAKENLQKMAIDKGITPGQEAAPPAETPEPPPPEPDQENFLGDNGSATISADDRQKFLDALRAKTGTWTEAQKDGAQRAVRAKLFKMGYTASKEVQYKDLPEMMTWVAALQPSV